MQYVTSTDGTRIAYERTGEGEPVVLVHGTGANHTCWEGVRSRLAAEDAYAVYAMDRRGRGDSGDADDYEIEREFDDVATLVEAIDGDVHLVGHSYGALTSLGAATRTDDLRSLVLYEPPLWTPGKELAPEAALEKMDDRIAAGDDEGVIETFFLDVTHSPERLEYYRTLDSWDMRLDAAPTMAREVRGTNVYRPSAEAFADVDVPALVMTGSESGGHLPDGARKAHELLQASEFRELDGLDHSAIYAAPDRFAENALSLIRES